MAPTSSLSLFRLRQLYGRNLSQALVDLVPGFDWFLRWYLGAHVSTCPVSEAVVAKEGFCGRGEWLWRQGTGRKVCQRRISTHQRTNTFLALLLSRHARSHSQISPVAFTALRSRDFSLLWKKKRRVAN